VTILSDLLSVQGDLGPKLRIAGRTKLQQLSISADFPTMKAQYAQRAVSAVDGTVADGSPRAKSGAYHS